MTYTEAIERLDKPIAFAYIDELTGSQTSVFGTLNSVWVYKDGDQIKANIQVKISEDRLPMYKLESVMVLA